MIKLSDGGVYLLNGTEVVEEKKRPGVSEQSRSAKRHHLMVNPQRAQHLRRYVAAQAEV
ncbi:hypothetical protein [Klebsiella pneumoniae IS39]|nr:hypothetical protein [Klebsiella pneumoniae IS39]